MRVAFLIGSVFAACTIFLIGRSLEREAFVPLSFSGNRIAASTVHSPAVHGAIGLDRLEQRHTTTFSFVPLVLLTALALRAQRTRTVRRSLVGCETLYFRRGLLIYPPRAQKNMRNRAYNIFMKNAYKRAARNVVRYARLLIAKEQDPGSLEKVMEQIKTRLDTAFELTDRACVQGVINRIEAAEVKDRMCNLLADGCIKQGYIEEPKDPFIPAFKLIGYEVPECNMVREPRPWQLPGWKSPWMLKREYDRWQRQKREEEKAAA